MTTSAASLEPTPEQKAASAHLTERPRPLGSMIASAARVQKKTVEGRRGFSKPESWQDDAWEMYDLVGEQRYLASTLGSRLAQAHFYVGRLAEDPVEDPEPLDTDDHMAATVFGYFGDTPQQRGQMIQRLGINLFVAGDGWLVGIPREAMPENRNVTSINTDEEETKLDDLQWRMLSVSEVSFVGGKVRLELGDGREDTVEADPDDVWMIRVWRPHPRRWWQADSPTRSSLPVLRELVSLTMHISAQVDSRLAGAGILVVPQSAQRAIAIAQGMDPDAEDDPFTEALMDAMLTAIKDRSSASALVPIVVVVPDEATGKFEHISFSTPLDAEARTLRDEAIRRLALGQDAPPELLLGTSSMNHWGAWLVREDVVTTHLEPPLALICDAITTQYLWPVLVEQGMDENEAQEYVVWYSVKHMVQRPNRLADASALHEKGVISDDALREAGGFGDTDAPTSLDRPVEIAIELAMKNPALIDNMEEIVAAFKKILSPSVGGDLPPSPTDTGEEIETEGQAEGAEETVDAEGAITDEQGPPADTPAQGPPNPTLPPPANA